MAFVADISLLQEQVNNLTEELHDTEEQIVEVRFGVAGDHLAIITHSNAA